MQPAKHLFDAPTPTVILGLTQHGYTLLLSQKTEQLLKANHYVDQKK